MLSIVLQVHTVINGRKGIREGVQISIPEKEHSLAETGIPMLETRWKRRLRGKRVKPI